MRLPLISPAGKPRVADPRLLATWGATNQLYGPAASTRDLWVEVEPVAVDRGPMAVQAWAHLGHGRGPHGLQQGCGLDCSHSRNPAASVRLGAILSRFARTR
jgi:hypothetical protein